MPLLLGAMALGGCAAGEQSPSDSQFALVDFEEIDLTTNNGTVLFSSDNDSTDYIGFPKAIKVLPGGQLAVTDIKGERQVIIIDSQGGYVQSLVAVGQGPDEMLRVNDLQLLDGELWLSSMGDNKLGKLVRNQDDSAWEYDYLRQLEIPIMRLAVLADRQLIVFPFNNTPHRCYTATLEGVVGDTITAFPYQPADAATPVDNSAFQVDLTVAPDGRRMAVVNKSWNAIELYDQSGHPRATLHGPLAIDSEIVEEETPIGMRYVQSPMWFMFSSASSNDQGFSVGFIGVQPKTPEDYNSRVHTILTFDWDGTPCQAIKVNDNVLSYDIDYANGILYLTTIDVAGIAKIVAYQLPLAQE